MKTATVRLWINKFTCMDKEGVTPAEAALLVADHHTAYGDVPVTILKKTEDVERTNGQERERLMGRYMNKKVVAMYPSKFNPDMPETFEQALQMGIETTLPTENLITVNS